MAYNASNEERTELYNEEKNNRGDHLIITKIENKKSGNVSLDIRNFYTNAEGELAPTTKGIRINTESLLDVMKAMVAGLEEDERYELEEFLASKDEEIKVLGE